jgi:nucleoside-diphosphate-sugar epimerase
MTALIIGANGLAGSAFTRILPGIGFQCRGVTRDTYHEARGARADVLILAHGNSAKYLAVQDAAGEVARSVAPIMAACTDFRYDLCLLLSSADVYPDTSDPARNAETAAIDPSRLSVYGLCKHLAEEVVRNRCARHMILRLGGLLGPGLRKNPLYDLLAGQPLRVHPDSQFGYIHTEEVARIAAGLLTGGRAPPVINVCGEGLVAVRDLAAWAGVPPPAADPAITPQRYAINNRRLSSLRPVPDSARTAQDFIRWWKEQART